MTLALYLMRFIFNRRIPDPMDFIDWVYFSKWTRIFWIVFYAFGLGAFVVISVTHGIPDLAATLSIGSIFVYGLVLFISHQPKPTEIIKQVIIERPAPPKDTTRFGVIYIMRRSDGVLKFGKAQHLAGRLRAHRKDYQTNFDVISSWVVPDVDDFEAKALSLTKHYFYQEGQRRELRQMSESELTQFILEFTNKVYQGWIQ